MTLDQVITNLNNTIAGKETMLEAMNDKNPYTMMFMEEGEVMARRATIEFLQINLGELRRIRDDLVLVTEKGN